MKTIRNVADVASWRLCLGCGACAYICPEKNVRIVDVLQDGLRPQLENGNCKDCGSCLAVCPGIHTEHAAGSGEKKDGISRCWGTVLELWEGFSEDAEIRYYGSSAGLATAIGLYCIEKAGMQGVLHIGSNPDEPIRNRTFLSVDRAGLLGRTGSRYSPASPCDGLDMIEKASGPCVFIGKPCDVTGLRKAQALREELDRRIGLAIGIFCAGTPSTQGTIDLLRNARIDPRDVVEMRYRGKGWPGMAEIRQINEDFPSFQMSYGESWGFLQQYRPFRCHLCPDGSSEFADISCGDPWYRKVENDEKGSSLVVVRTELGKKILHGAITEGYVNLKRVHNGLLEASQINLLWKRRSVWGRILAMKAFGIPYPRLFGFHLFSNWLDGGMEFKARSVLGTVKRIVARKYYKPCRYGNASMNISEYSSEMTIKKG